MSPSDGMDPEPGAVMMPYGLFAVAIVRVWEVEVSDDVLESAMWADGSVVGLNWFCCGMYRRYCRAILRRQLVDIKI